MFVKKKKIVTTRSLKNLGFQIRAAPINRHTKKSDWKWNKRRGAYLSKYGIYKTYINETAIKDRSCGPVVAYRMMYLVIVLVGSTRQKTVDRHGLIPNDNSDPHS